MSERPRLIVLVTGTGTEIGKTWVAAAMAGELGERGWVVSARKPAQSFDPADPAAHDADVLAAATGELAIAVCPPHRNYEVALAPPMAADALGRPSFTVAELVDEVEASWPAHAVDVGIVELAGGFRSPQASPEVDDVGTAGGDDCRAFADRLVPDLLVVVADAGLGTINAVRATLDGVPGDDQPTVVILNRFDADDDLHRRNQRWLTDVDHIGVVTDVAALADGVEHALDRYCVACGRTTAECAGCLGEFDAARRCPRCGRRLRVVVTPTSVTGSCRLHGEIT